MSLHIEVSRAEGATKWFTIDSLTGSFGEDKFGRCTVENPKTTIFSSFANGDVDSIVLAEKCRSLITGEIFNEGEVLKTGSIHQLSCRDWLFSLYSISRSIDALAKIWKPPPLRTERITTSAIVSYLIGGVTVSTKLFPGFRYSLGSSNEAAICIPLNMIRPHHLDLTVEPSGTQISGLGTLLTVDNSSEIEIAPNGFKISISVLRKPTTLV